MNNRYETRGDITAIFTNHKGTIIETIVDTKMLDRVNDFPNTWVSKRCGKLLYVIGNEPRNGKKREAVYLHRWVTEADKGMDVDHINHNTLDNRTTNLRVVSHKENSVNRKGANANSKSGVRGVNWNKKHGKWYARFTENGKIEYLGCFENIEEASKAVNERIKRCKYDAS